jgi:hypothetical protein
MTSTFKYFFIVSFILLFYSEINSQPISWKRVYGSIGEEEGRIVQQTFDGGYIVGYYSYDTDKTNLLKLNLFGEKEWEKEINDTVGTENPVNIELTDDNGFILITRYGIHKSRIIKTDSLGNIQWTKNYRYENYNTFSTIFEHLSNDNYILGGTILGFNPPLNANFLTYFDNEFNILWQTYYRDSTGNSINDIVFYNNTFYIIGGTHNGGPLYSNFVKYDINGNFISKLTYPFPNYSINKFTEFNGYLYSTGDYLLYPTYLKGLTFQIVDTNGSILSTSHYSFYNSLNRAYGIIKTLDNNFIILSANGGPIDYDAIILKIDPTGNEIFRRYITAGDSTIDFFDDIRSTSDSGLIMTGNTTYGSVFSNNVSIFVVKTDANGNSPPVRIEQINTNIPENFTVHQNYPNPFNPSTTVKFEIPNNGTMKMILFDMLGKEITSLVDKELEAGSYSLNINFNDLRLSISSGIYFIRAAYNGKLKTIKVVFNK